MPKEPISKTQRKKAVHALQDLGAELVALNEAQLAAVELPERLRDAVMAARRISGFEARRRQLQYIGKIMRNVDPGPIRAALAVWQAQSRSHTAIHKRIEAWRERLLSEPDSIAQLLAEFPRANGQRLRALARNALRERAAGQPPRAFRELYHALRVLLAKDEG